MLISVGKLSSIAEMFTIKLAASEPPGDRQTSIFVSLVVSFHLAGTVHDIPCWSHLTVCPPASASICAAVAVGGSPSPLLSVELVVGLAGSADLFVLVSLLVKLQRE